MQSACILLIINFSLVFCIFGKEILELLLTCLPGIVALVFDEILPESDNRSLSLLSIFSGEKPINPLLDDASLGIEISSLWELGASSDPDTIEFDLEILILW